MTRRPRFILPSLLLATSLVLQVAANVVSLSWLSIAALVLFIVGVLWAWSAVRRWKRWESEALAEAPSLAQAEAFAQAQAQAPRAPATSQTAGAPGAPVLPMVPVIPVGPVLPVMATPVAPAKAVADIPVAPTLVAPVMDFPVAPEGQAADDPVERPREAPADDHAVLEPVVETARSRAETARETAGACRGAVIEQPEELPVVSPDEALAERAWAPIATAAQFDGWELTTALEPRPEAPAPPPASSEPPLAPEPPRPSASAPKHVPTFPAMAAPTSMEASYIVETLFEASGVAGRAVAAHLWLLDPPSATLRLVAAAGPFAPPAVPVPVSDPSLGGAVSRGAATISPPAGTPPSTLPWRTRFAVPVSAGSSRGVAAVDFYDTTTPDLETLIGVFAQASGVLAGTLGLFVAQDDNHRSHLLAEATRELAASTDEDAIVHRTLDRAMDLSGGATGSVMLVDPLTGRMRIAASRGLPGDVVDDTDVAEGDGIAGWVLSTRKPMLVEDLPQEGASGSQSRHGVRSSLSVPILDVDEALGVLNVGTRAYPARFTDDHTEALSTLAAQCAAALRHVRAEAANERTYLDTLRALVGVLEQRDPYGHGDADRIARLSEALGTAVGMDERQRRTLRIAALLHDIGMGAAGGSVNAEDRPLSLTQRGLVAMHPALGAGVLSEVPGLAEAGPIVAHHHERYDGGGYGGGLAGEAIPLGARVLAVADAYTAMTSDRPHRPAMPLGAAVAEIRQNAGTQFDPRVVDAFCDLAQRDPQLLAS